MKNLEVLLSCKDSIIMLMVINGLSSSHILQNCLLLFAVDIVRNRKLYVSSSALNSVVHREYIKNTHRPVIKH